MDECDKQTGSVLRSWVSSLPLRYQGTLLTGIRGCDLVPKPFLPTEHSAARELTAFFRYCVLVPADPRELDTPGAFMRTSAPYPTEWKPSEFGHYPLHWYSHLMHCFEIVAYHHPDPEIAMQAGEVYQRLVHALHLNPETPEQLRTRLTEDRIASGTVVS